jgi:hypothetical protein
VRARKLSYLTFEGLKKIGVVLTRAKHFITVGGRYYGQFNMREDMIYEAISEKKDRIQLNLFSEIDENLALVEKDVNPILFAKKQTASLMADRLIIQKSLGGNF